MREPVATVILPTYNRPEYLGVAIESALAQTFHDFELVVADDASTEDIAGLVSRFRDDRIVFVRRPVNVGMAANVWPALAGARGRYVATLHDDDAWEPQFLEVMVQALETHPEASAAFSDHWIMDGAGAVDPQATEENTKRFRRDGLAPGLHFPSSRLVVEWNAIPNAMAALFRKSAIAWNEEPGEIGTFYDHWLGHLATRSAAVHYDPRRLTRYRVHARSETAGLRTTVAKLLRSMRQTEALWRRILDDTDGTAVHEFAHRRYVRSLARASLTLAAHGERAEARRMLERSEGHVALVAHAALRCAIELPAVAVRSAISTLQRLGA
jgi:glycosyltransferase involved in cell wall biosynthesis